MQSLAFRTNKTYGVLGQLRSSDKDGKGIVEKRFAVSGASSVSDSETDEAPESTKRFSTIPFPSLSNVLK